MFKKYWSDKETQWLIDNYSIYGNKYCAEYLGISQDQIRYKIGNLKKHGIEILYRSLVCDKKLCTKCQVLKSLDNFFKDKKGKGGVHAMCKSCFAKRDKERYIQDIDFQLIKRLRTRFKKFIKNESFSKNTELILGCSVEECKLHIEKQFNKDMSWNTEWHLDHIIPMDLIKNNHENIHLVLNYRNLQPLSIIDNLVKSDNLHIAKQNLLEKIKIFGIDSIYQKMIDLLEYHINENCE